MSEVTDAFIFQYMKPASRNEVVQFARRLFIRQLIVEVVYCLFNYNVV